MQQAQEPAKIVTVFEYSQDNGIELQFEYIPKTKVILIKGENSNCGRDYQLKIDQNLISQTNSNLPIDVEDLYQLLLTNLSKNQQQQTSVVISQEGELIVVFEVSIGSKQIKFPFVFKFQSQEQTLETKLEKQGRIIIKMQKQLHEQQQQIQDLLISQRELLLSPFNPKASSVPTVDKDFGNLEHFSFPANSVVQKITPNSWACIIATKPLEKNGKQMFKVKILQSSANHFMIGICKKEKSVSRYQAQGTACYYTNNGSLYINGVNQAYMAPIIQKNDVILTIVDVENQTIQFIAPGTVFNKKVSLTINQETQLYPFIELHGQNDQVQFVE